MRRPDVLRARSRDCFNSSRFPAIAWHPGALESVLVGLLVLDPGHFANPRLVISPMNLVISYHIRSDRGHLRAMARCLPAEAPSSEASPAPTAARNVGAPPPGPPMRSAGPERPKSSRHPRILPFPAVICIMTSACVGMGRSGGEFLGRLQTGPRRRVQNAMQRCRVKVK